VLGSISPSHRVAQFLCQNPIPYSKISNQRSWDRGMSDLFTASQQALPLQNAGCIYQGKLLCSSVLLIIHGPITSITSLYYMYEDLLQEEPSMIDRCRVKSNQCTIHSTIHRDQQDCYKPNANGKTFARKGHGPKDEWFVHCPTASYPLQYAGYLIRVSFTVHQCYS